VRPRMLLLDEPLSALDAGLRERLAVDLRDILREAGTTALMVTHDHEEAFTVADRLAVMRDGRVVQDGPIDQVWASPVDRPTALFLGYARVLEGAPAATVLAQVDAGPGAGRLPAGGGWGVALRRSALVVDDGGGLAARVVSARTTPGQTRLVVDVAGIGLLDAVAPLRSRLGPGDPVSLRVDVSRIAHVGT
jgi:thiamine transport system ATP-binding protein